nr:PREDICTED: histone deacetylase complex subunit SAP25 isoform X1 [Lepisosteus oculatus]
MASPVATAAGRVIDRQANGEAAGEGHLGDSGELKRGSDQGFAGLSTHMRQVQRPAVLPCLSSRTLPHPSFYSLYVAMGSVHGARNRSGHPNRQPVPAMCPADFYYTDPMLPPGSRICNTMSQLEVLECCQLNTPPPIMSACQAPPPGPNPFSSTPHPVRQLGQPTWDRKWRPRETPQSVGSRRIGIVQLNPEEDQAVTSLLRLHYDQFPVERNAGEPVLSPLQDKIPLGDSTVYPDSECGANDLPRTPTDATLFPAAESCTSGGHSEEEMEAVHALLELEGRGLCYPLEEGPGRSAPESPEEFGDGDTSEPGNGESIFFAAHLPREPDSLPAGCPELEDWPVTSDQLAAGVWGSLGRESGDASQPDPSLSLALDGRAGAGEGDVVKERSKVASVAGVQPAQCQPVLESLPGLQPYQVEGLTAGEGWNEREEEFRGLEGGRSQALPDLCLFSDWQGSLGQTV